MLPGCSEALGSRPRPLRQAAPHGWARWLRGLVRTPKPVLPALPLRAPFQAPRPQRRVAALPGGSFIGAFQAASVVGGAGGPWGGGRAGQARGLVREIIKADGHADVAWEADVHAKVDQPLPLGPWGEGLVSPEGPAGPARPRPLHAQRVPTHPLPAGPSRWGSLHRGAAPQPQPGWGPLHGSRARPAAPGCGGCPGRGCKTPGPAEKAVVGQGSGCGQLPRPRPQLLSAAPRGGRQSFLFSETGASAVPGHLGAGCKGPHTGPFVAGTGRGLLTDVFSSSCRVSRSRASIRRRKQAPCSEGR